MLKFDNPECGDAGMRGRGDAGMWGAGMRKCWHRDIGIAGSPACGDARMLERQNSEMRRFGEILGCGAVNVGILACYTQRMRAC